MGKVEINHRLPFVVRHWCSEATDNLITTKVNNLLVSTRIAGLRKDAFSQYKNENDSSTDS